MSAQNDGGPAFPVACSDTVNYDAGPQPGMTLRDWFASQSLEIVSFEPLSGITRSDAEIARAAYGLADAMLAARVKEGAQ